MQNKNDGRGAREEREVFFFGTLVGNLLCAEVYAKPLQNVWWRLGYLRIDYSLLLPIGEGADSVEAETSYLMAAKSFLDYPQDALPLTLLLLFRKTCIVTCRC